MRRPAWIAFGGSSTPVSCVVWDLSEGGARLTAAHSNLLPDIFVLFLTKDGKSPRYCRAKWRKKPHLGVEFIQPSECRSLIRCHEEFCPVRLPGGASVDLR